MTEQQQINMNIAMFKKAEKGMYYAFKEYDAAKNWKMYAGWLAVHRLPKFQFQRSDSSQNSVATTDLAESEDVPSSGAEFVETRMPERG